MAKLMIIVVIIVLVLGAAHFIQADGCRGCGMVPLRPIPPIGCKDLKPVCRCDVNGCHCGWVWECVPY